MIKKIIAILVLFTLFVNFGLFSVAEQLSPIRYSYGEAVWNVKYDDFLNYTINGSNIPKSDIPLTESSFLRFANFWQATCQHVAHDEWNQYIVNENGEEVMLGGSYCWYAQRSYEWNPDELHSWRSDLSLKTRSEIEAMGEGAYIYPGLKNPTPTENGFTWKVKATCVWGQGWWGGGPACGAAGYEKVIIKYDGSEDSEDPGDGNNPPQVTIYAPTEIKAGDEFGVLAVGYDPDGDKLTYNWNIGVASGNVTGQSGTLWYTANYANTTQQITAFASDKNASGVATALIQVTPPTVDINIEITGTLKENRKVTITDTSHSPKHYPIIERYWTISPVTSSGTTHSDIKYDGRYNFISNDFIFKKAGEYEVTLYVVNSPIREDGGSDDLKILYVTCSVDSFSTTPSKSAENHWVGSLWHESMIRWENGPKIFTFTVTFSNGVVKMQQLTITVEDDEYWSIPVIKNNGL